MALQNWVESVPSHTIYIKCKKISVAETSGCNNSILLGISGILKRGMGNVRLVPCILVRGTWERGEGTPNAHCVGRSIIRVARSHAVRPPPNWLCFVAKKETGGPYVLN